MPDIAQIAAAIEAIAPSRLAEAWDNVGVLVDCGGKAESLLVCLDITDETLAEAERLACRLVVSHHPVIFAPLRRLARGQIAYKMVRKGISALCAHTNLDAAAGGVNDVLAGIFGLQNPAPFGPGGRVGRLKQPAATADLAAFCARKLNAHVRYADGGKPIKTLAVLGGSGGGMLSDLQAAGADALLTGEADHHDAIDARQAGISTIVAGHFSTEFVVVPVLAGYLQRQFPDVKVHISARDKDPFNHITL